MIVNLGVADCPFQARGTAGNCNIDIISTGNEDVRADARYLPFCEQTVDGIYAHHLLEHLRREDGYRAVIHWRHTLKLGGFLSIVVPDWHKLCAGSTDFFERDRFIFGHDDARGPFQPHQSLWAEREVIDVMRDCGFRDIQPIDIATYEPLVARPLWQSGARGIR